MVRHLFVDFDGTLVDSRVRQYELFVELIGKRDLTLDEYWSEKRVGIKQGDMLLKYANFSDEEKSAFKDRWNEAIEESRRLLADELIAGASEFLAEASKHFQLFLVTGRQHKKLLIDQMQRLNIESYFSGVLNTAHRMPKAQFVRTNVELSDEDVFIGDSNEDILAGKELGLFTVGVTSGASTSERLMKYRPNLIVASVAELRPQMLGFS